MIDYEYPFRRDSKNILEMDKETLKLHLEYNFIKYYKVYDNNMIIYFSDINVSIPYDKEIELQILDKMKDQINEYKNINYDITASDYFLSSIWATNGLLQGLLSLINDSFPIPNITAMILSLITTGLYTRPIIRKNIIRNDIEKHLLFLENEDEINKKIKEEMLSLRIIDEETINLIPLFDSRLTINDIHFMNKKQIQELIDGNIDKEIIYKLKKD